MDEATADLRRRLDEILDREQRAQRDAARLRVAAHERVPRSPPSAERRRLSDAIERSATGASPTRRRASEFRELLDRARAHAQARGVPAAARRALPRRRGRRLRDRAADPRAHRGAGAARARSRERQLPDDRPRAAARAALRERAAIAGAAARPALVARARRLPARRRRRPSSRRARSAASARRRSRRSTARCARVARAVTTRSARRRASRAPTRRVPGSSATPSTSTS